MSAAAAILAWLCGSEDDTCPAHLEASPYASTARPLTESEMASNVLYILRNAEKNGPYVRAQVSNAVSPHGWTENIASAVVKGLEKVITEGREKVGQALREVIDAAEAAAKVCFTFSKEHPYLTAGFVTIVAVGVLVLIAPWAVEALGFGRLGPIANTFAAVWQRTYVGFIPKGSLFSFLQRLGMTWK